MRKSHQEQNTKTAYDDAWHEKQSKHLQSKTLASEMSLTAAASTMFLMTNFLIALSLGTQRAQLVQRMGCTCPRPFLARPLFLLFLVCKRDANYSLTTRFGHWTYHTSSSTWISKTVKYQSLASTLAMNTHSDKVLVQLLMFSHLTSE